MLYHPQHVVEIVRLIVVVHSSLIPIEQDKKKKLFLGKCTSLDLNYSNYNNNTLSSNIF